MAETQPFMLQELCYTAAEFRQNINANVCFEGVVDLYGGDLLVETSGLADHSVTVAAGMAFIAGDNDAPDEGMYRIRNDAPIVIQLTAGGGGNPRVDTIYATVQNTGEYGGSGDNDWVADVVAGTADAAASLTDAGIAASAGVVPDNSIILAYVLVPAADTLTTIISAANILDARNNYLECGATPWCSLEAAAVTAVGSGAWTQVTLATVAHRDRRFFTVTGSTITVEQDGLYDVNAFAGFSGAGAGGALRGVSILVNNTNLPNASPNGTNVADVRVQDPAGTAANALLATPTRMLLNLQNNDTIKLAVFQDSGGSVNTANIAAHLTVRKVG